MEIILTDKEMARNQIRDIIIHSKGGLNVLIIKSADNIFKTFFKCLFNVKIFNKYLKNIFLILIKNVKGLENRSFWELQLKEEVRSDELYVKLLESCMINRKADSARIIFYRLWPSRPTKCEFTKNTNFFKNIFR